MNKYQERNNKIKPYKFLLNKKQIDMIIYNDDIYKIFIKLIDIKKRNIKDMIKKLLAI